MTDKERYEEAMKENHRLREELKDWKEAFNALVIDGKDQQEDFRKLSELYLKEQQKNGELEQINQNLTDNEKARLKDKFKAYETGQAWIYLQKKALLKAVDEDEPTGVWAKVAMECERIFKECQDELKKLIKEDSTKKP